MSFPTVVDAQRSLNGFSEAFPAKNSALPSPGTGTGDQFDVFEDHGRNGLQSVSAHQNGGRTSGHKWNWGTGATSSWWSGWSTIMKNLSWTLCNKCLRYISSQKLAANNANHIDKPAFWFHMCINLTTVLTDKPIYHYGISRFHGVSWFWNHPRLDICVNQPWRDTTPGSLLEPADRGWSIMHDVTSNVAKSFLIMVISGGLQAAMVGNLMVSGGQWWLEVLNKC